MRKIPRGELRENLLIASVLLKDMQDLIKAIRENQLAMPKQQLQLRDDLEVLRGLIEPVVKLPPARFTRVFTATPRKEK